MTKTTAEIQIWVGGPDGRGSFLRTRQVSVRADVYGDLAVFRSFHGGQFTVGHIPTGASIERDLSKLQAIELIILIGHLDWSFTDMKQAEPYRQIVTEAVEDVRRRAETVN